MKKRFAWAASGILLVGCGGGGDSSPPPVQAQPVPPPVVVTPPAPPPAPPAPPVTPPPPPPPPVVSLLSGTVTRHIAANTGISMDVMIKPDFTPAGTLYASATPNGASLVPAEAVAVTRNSDGSYTLAMSTVPNPSAGSYAGEWVVKLCSDQACATPQAVPSIKVPYALTVAAAGNAWPGDKITPLAPWADVPDWTTFQGNAAHTGFVPVTLDPDKFSLRWKAGSIQGASTFGTPVPTTLAATNGLFYAPKNLKLEARKELDGSVVWAYDISSLQYPSLNPPAVGGGMVYVAAGQQGSTFMFGLDAAAGTVVFKTPMTSQWESYLAPVVYDNAVYTNAGSYGGLYAIKSTGELLFTAHAPQTDKWSPAVDADSAYVFLENTLRIFDRKTGVLRSQIRDTAATNGGYTGAGAPVLASPGSVIAADYGATSWSGNANALLRFNVDKGYVDWRVPGSYTVTPAYANGVIYAPNKSPYRLEARAESDAALRWSWTPPIAGEATWGGEPVVTNNMVFVSTEKNTYAIDLRTGKAVWSYPMAGRLAITRSGLLYINATDALVTINLK